MSGLEIVSIAPTATVQDQGRVGFLRFGVTSSGAMDVYGLAEGQALLGNRPDDAALEFAEYGGRFCARQDMPVALSGAEMSARLNGTPCGWRKVLNLRAGDVLEIGAAADGVYGYLHAAGGFQTEVVLNARSTHRRAGFGHLLAAGQVLNIGDAARKCLPLGLARPDYFDQRVLRIMWGPQSKYFTDKTRQRFLEAEFVISEMRDRMGIQITPDCAKITADSGLSIASDTINLGDIQITGDGTPAVLLADRGPSGGYPRIATLCTADMGALAQISTGGRFRFVLVGRPEAVEVLRKFRKKMNGLREQVKPMTRDPRDMADLLAYNLVDGVITGENDLESIDES